MFRLTGVVEKVGGGQLDPNAEDLVLTAGWGHAGKDGVTMPAKGKMRERPFTAEEMEAISATGEGVLALLGPDTRDIYLNRAESHAGSAGVGAGNTAVFHREVHDTRRGHGSGGCPGQSLQAAGVNLHSGSGWLSHPCRAYGKGCATNCRFFGPRAFQTARTSRGGRGNRQSG